MAPLTAASVQIIGYPTGGRLELLAEDGDLVYTPDAANRE